MSAEKYDFGRNEGALACSYSPMHAAKRLGLREVAFDNATRESVLAAVRERIRTLHIDGDADDALDHWHGVHDVLRDKWKLMSHTYNHVDILRGTFGCPCGRHLRADPYPFRDDAAWHDAARGDGRSYSGGVERVWRAAGESDDALLVRAEARAAELEAAEQIDGNGCYRCAR